MSSPDFHQLLRLVPTLAPDQLRLLRWRVEAAGAMTKPEPPAETDEPLQRRLLDLGIVSEIKPPRRPARFPFTPITITGEPLSATVIRDQR